ncbi:MAG: HEAT repeat domain-containing protein [Candidatus Hodarchaeales archaeon]
MSEKSVIIDLKNLRSKDPGIKWEALNNLKKYLSTNPPSLRKKLIIKSFLALTKDPDDKIRETVFITLLETVKDPKSLESFVTNGLKDSSPGIRSLALEWLHKNDNPRIREFTIQALQDPKEVVKKTALEIVAARQITGIETTLLDMLNKDIDTSSGLRRSIIFALGKLKTEEAVGSLIGIMQNTEYDDWTRNQASSALEHVGGKEIIVPYIKNLADPNEYVRETAAAYLDRNRETAVEIITQSRNIEYLALLKHASEHTKKDFSELIETLTSELRHELEVFKADVLQKDKFSLHELAEQMNTIELVIKILLTSVLQLPLIKLEDGDYLTETGLKNLLLDILATKHSLYLPELIKKEPFKWLLLEQLEKVLEMLENAHRVTSDLFIDKNSFESIMNEYNENGLLEISKIASQLNLSDKVIKKDFIEGQNLTEKGWFNTRNEFFNEKFLIEVVRKEIEQYHSLSIKELLNRLGNPNIEHERIKLIISENFDGVWLEDILVFIEKHEFDNLRENSARLEEEGVKHILSAINLDYNTFLDSLRKVLKIEVFKTKDGQLIPLEKLYPMVKGIILSKGYIDILEFLKEQKLEENVHKELSQHIIKEYNVRSDPSQNLFVTEELIVKIEDELGKFSRINFSVTAFKLDIPEEILRRITGEILFVRGFHNKIGEFITEKGLSQEINGLLEFRQEFPINELYELLEINQDQKHKAVVREVVVSNHDLMILTNEVVITHKQAIAKVLELLKQPEVQSKEFLTWQEFSDLTGIPKVDLVSIIESLTQNQLLPGTMQENGYKP